ncbi:hypothetical protein Q9L58_009727 [Maublancomyces gigas]|uniref:Uncharacterized protein n=1 Tax=Discina gigas TaxID=1032678 RepID=A0ABR3G630_9PEZI
MASSIPALLWGSEVWWSGASHILDQIRPAYHTVARAITGLPRCTPIAFLLNKAGMAPIDLLLDKSTQRYGIRILLNSDDHPCKKTVMTFLTEGTKNIDGTGIRRVNDVLRRIIPTSPRMEDPTHHEQEWMPPAIIPTLDKAVEAANHMSWLNNISDRCILAYSDRSKEDNGRTSSAWHVVQTRSQKQVILFEGACQIDIHCDIEDGEIHAIQQVL